MRDETARGPHVPNRLDGNGFHFPLPCLRDPSFLIRGSSRLRPDRMAPDWRRG